MRFGGRPDRGSTRQFRRVATGGTFDHIHAGHGAILKRSFDVGDEVVIGLTSDDFVAKIGKHPDNSFLRRKQELKDYIKKHFPGRTYIIAKLDDYFGPGIVDPSIQALVASPETSIRIELANRLREEKGYSPLALVTVDWVKAEDGKPLSSTRIRRGEVDPAGRIIRRRKRLVRVPSVEKGI
jgi:pantetheine-phosphate adenylyltransferase